MMTEPRAANEFEVPELVLSPKVMRKFDIQIIGQKAKVHANELCGGILR